VTEFLPVSSTGHLILATELMGYDAARWAVFNVAIQPGAILAIVVLYWRTFIDVLTGLFRRDVASFAFVRNLLIAFIPAVALGLAFSDQIDALLENAVVVAWALILGGIAILVVERLAKVRDVGGVAAVTTLQSVKIGLVQCIAMIPGVSRSGATILGAMSLGIDRKTAAEFSFFLALPTLSGATVLQLYKHRDAISSGDLGLIGIGFFVSFIVALLVVRGFLAVITRYGFVPFAWYRIVAGVAALVWLGMR
jgi:undecaprenyl-diphosphatase